MSHAKKHIKKCNCGTCSAFKADIIKRFPDAQGKRDEIIRIAINRDLGPQTLRLVCETWICEFSDLQKAYTTTQNLYASVRDTVYELDQKAA